MTKIMKIGAVALGLLALPSVAFAQERLRDGALGAVGGAIVGGPVGAVAGGAIGYTQGPRISNAFDRRHRYYRHRHYYRRDHRY